MGDEASFVHKFLILLSGRKGGDTSDADQEQGGSGALSHEHRQVFYYFFFIHYMVANGYEVYDKADG
jgi:hypothetical protein